MGNLESGVVISLYQKSTVSNSVLLATSCHPIHVTNGAKEETCCRLKYRKYPDWSLNSACNIVNNINRNDLLQTKKLKHSVSSAMPTVTFSTNFSPAYNQIVKIIKNTYRFYVAITILDK